MDSTLSVNNQGEFIIQVSSNKVTLVMTENVLPALRSNFPLAHLQIISHH
jgi:hypothetical protein